MFSFGNLILIGASILLGAKAGFDFAMINDLPEKLSEGDKELNEKVKTMISKDEELLNQYIEARESYKKFKEESSIDEEEL